MNKDELLQLLKQKGHAPARIHAFDKVKREEFVPEHLIPYAYEDIALPIEDGSALSQPSTIAFMLSLLDVQETSKVLEIGAGSGYVLALLGELAQHGQVYGVEVHKALAIQAKKRLLGKHNLHIIQRNGFQGLAERAPFDRIMLSAACKEKPYHLLSQLTDAGILVAPVNDTIVQIKKVSGTIQEETYPGFAFVPLVES